MFRLPELPYAHDALEPHISAETMKFHHDKHHRKYVDTLNKLTNDSPLAEMSLEGVIEATGDGENDEQKKIFNNAAQCWNHEFFWKSMTPEQDRDANPDDRLQQMIERDFGDRKTFNEQFADAATGHFGSGWAWLVLAGDSVEIMTTHDADLPLAHGHTALLTCDLWEHAYYLDYQNDRPGFIEAFLKHLANWEFAAANLQVASEAQLAAANN